MFLVALAGPKISDVKVHLAGPSKWWRKERKHKQKEKCKPKTGDRKGQLLSRTALNL